MGLSREQWSDRSAALGDLLARVALGDRAAFASLYKDCSAHLFGVILRIQADPAHAEDLLQDIFVNIWRTAQTFDAARAQPLTWLTSIARHRAIDSLRRRKTEVDTLSSQLPGDDDEQGLDLISAIASDDPSPFELLAQAAQARSITHCLDELSADQQQCVSLAFYQGLSYREVAQHLTQPLGTVKSWVRRALGSLKDCLAREPAAVIGRVR